MLLNNDTEVDAQFLEPLVEKLETDSKAAIASSKIIYYKSDNIIQYAGGKNINPFTGRGSLIGTHKKDNQQFFSQLTNYSHGAAMMVKRKVIEEIGMMAELYFLYYEELDFCERVKRAGYHKESISVGKESTLKIYYMTRNRILFMRRNNQGISLYAFFIYFSLIAVPKNIFHYIQKKRMDLLISFLKGYVWNFTHFNISENPRFNQ